MTKKFINKFINVFFCHNLEFKLGILTKNIVKDENF